jgi:uncharacterized protein with NRDE domain
MCLAVVALDAHPSYALVLAANRDEFHRRPTAPAAWWTADAALPILAGRDLEQGGTWLGITRYGRWGFVTNVREPARHDPGAPTRGMLVPALARDTRPVLDAIAALLAGARAYNGFNLMGGDAAGVAFGSNRGTATATLGRGIHGVSNAGLDTPWPKLVRMKTALAAWGQSGAPGFDALWAALADRTPAGDDELPATGIPRERERLLSAPFIVSNEYGTRCSTIVAIGRDCSVQFVERSFDAAGAPAGEARFRFQLEGAGVPSSSSMTRWAMPASSNTSPRATNP